MQILLFTGTWCQQCKSTKKILHELKIEFKEVDVDDNPQITKTYKISHLPTLIFLDADGKISETLVGTLSPNKIKEAQRKIKE